MALHSTSNSKGLLGSMRALAATLVNMAHTRLALLSSDVEENNARLMSIAIFTMIALFSLLYGLLMLSMFVLMFFWDTHRLLIMGSIAGSFMLIGAIALGFAILKIKTKPKLFMSSLLELAKDHQQLEAD